MVQIKRKLEQFGAHSFLLPVFFVLHNYLQYAGLVSGAAAVKVLVEIEFIFIVSFIILLLITRNVQRSAQITTLLGFIALFYGVIKDFFSDTLHFPFMARYRLLLPVIIIVSLLLIVRISRKKDFSKPNRFQNILLLLFLFTEVILLLCSGTGVYRQRNQLVKNNILTPANLPVITGQPDVYFLVFDSYPGTDFMHAYLQYNNALDSMLTSKGFYVVSHPKSNYNRTALSMAATLNFEFLQNIPDQSNLEPKHYNQASLSIAHAAAIAVFIHNGYQVYNLSVFDLEQQPSMFKENFLVLPEEKMLLYNTLAERFQLDVLWNFHLPLQGNTGRTDAKKRRYQDLFTKESIKKRDFNNKLIDSLPKISLQDGGKPKFIYAHFYLPHPPFFYNRNGDALTLKISDVEQSMEQTASFISYLEYTNKVILKLVKSILRDPQKEPVIIVQSDHGYRDFKKSLVNPGQYFKNYSAFYFPDKNYSTLYDTLSNINTFPVIFNKYFKTNIPLQKDTSVFTGY
ncbi:MAG TPA: sulfatase-like hydrolase/transferase [Chitinophagaceae bacterium]|nr:sulfatase-like hydrolase/transferase [Chitinophagaceae bacterium]